MSNSQSHASSRFKIIVICNALFNISALVTLICFINDKSLYYEIAILRVMLTGASWIVINLIFGIFYKLVRVKMIDNKALQLLMKIHSRLAIALFLGMLTVIVPVLIILEIMGMVAAFFLPFVMLVVAIKTPGNSQADIFE